MVSVLKMKSQFKFIMLALVALIAIMGSVFANPITVNDVNVQKVNDDYVVIATVQNQNATVASGLFTELGFTIGELGTTFTDVPRKFDTTTPVVLKFNLKDVVPKYNLLKAGQSYSITVSSQGSSKTEAFVFGDNSQTTTGLGLLLDSVKVNGEEVSDVNTLQVMNGQSTNVAIRFTANEKFDDARLMVFVEGYEHAPLIASTDVFSVVPGKTYVKTLTLNLPADMVSTKDYTLRIAGANDLSGLTYKEYKLYVDTDRNRVDVKDLVMTPASGVEPGQNIVAQVRMKNFGQKTQDSVKVTVAIPALNVAESSYISNLGLNEVATSDDMLLSVPETAKAGQYDVQVTLSYNSGYDKTTSNYTMNVLAAKSITEESLLASLPKTADLVAGEAKSFDVVIANPNKSSKPISVAVADNAWADVTVSPSLKMIQAGSSEVFTVTVTPKSAVVGTQDLTLVVKEGNAAVQELKVSSYVEASKQLNWLNVVLAVLLVLAIIILLAIVISIARRKNDGADEGSNSSEEYY